MTFIPKKIRLLPLSVALITTLSLGTSAFAATCTTTTTYIGDSKVSVTSKITGASSPDQITFLVAKANPSSTSDFVYIDQTAADSNGEATFKFSTHSDNLGIGATVKFGAQTTTSFSGNNVPFSITDQVPEPATRRMSDPGTPLAPYNADETALSITAFGRLLNGTASDSCGILLSTDLTQISKTYDYSEVNAMTTLTTPVRKFAALGAISGINGGRTVDNKFAIQLVNGSGAGAFLVAGTTYYTRTYGVYNSLVTFGEVRTVVIPLTQ